MFEPMKYARLAELKAIQKEAKEEEELIKAELIEDMKDRGSKTDKTVYGVFSIATRKSYKYSNKVKEMSEDLKIKQQDEIENGIAVVTENSHITFKPNKE